MKTNVRILLAMIVIAALCNFALILGLLLRQGGRAFDGTKRSRPRETKEVLTDQDVLCGIVTMAGSTSMEKLMNALAESFMLRHENVTVTAEFTGSSAGIEALLAGRAEIGCSSRRLTERERNMGAVENVVAIDVIAVITDCSNPVTSLTKEQLRDIYTGKIRNWREVGGKDETVVVVGREAGSGTRMSFEEALDVAGKCAYANELDSTGAVVAKAVTIPGVIGYVSLDVAGEGVRIISIDGRAPSEENAYAGNYPLTRPFVMATKGTIDEQGREIRALFNFLQSKEGRQVIRAAGCFPS